MRGKPSDYCSCGYPVWDIPRTPGVSCPNCGRLLFINYGEEGI